MVASVKPNNKTIKDYFVSVSFNSLPRYRKFLQKSVQVVEYGSLHCVTVFGKFLLRQTANIFTASE